MIINDSSMSHLLHSCYSAVSHPWCRDARGGTAGPGLLVHVHPSHCGGFVGFLHLQTLDASHVLGGPRRRGQGYLVG